MSTTAIENFLESEEEYDFQKWLEEEIDIEEDTPEKEIKKEDIPIEDLLVNSNIKPDELNDIEKEMYYTILNSDKVAWERGEGFSTGFKLLDDKFMGIQSGLVFVGAQSNVGKSSFLLYVANQSSIAGDVYSLYFSFDDGSKDLLPRIVASEKNIPINAIRLPERYLDYPTILEKRKDGIRDLYSSLDRFKIIDQDKGKSIELVEKEVEKHLNYLEEIGSDRKLFVQIDNFHDLTSEDKTYYSEKEKYSDIADRLRNLSEKFNIPIWCTAELRKGSSGHTNVRPVKEDIKEAGKIVYRATACLMLYNEVGLEQQNAAVFYRSQDRPGKNPIVEVHFDKNKQSSYKGRLYYKFVPEYALFVEATEGEVEYYNNLIYQN